MKKIIILVLLFCLSTVSFSAKSYWEPAWDEDDEPIYIQEDEPAISIPAPPRNHYDDFDDYY
ncbi:hypothetical protein JMUB3935_0621 [Leptotrichia trevisanii]|uniref:Secreted protein n=1 Tax=Leptotrichia trevisanii TaxID=109328 RepID=A0A510KK68_9FUSO|nr:hypothetical protein JMUB3935_0621 [Leptotrichia trevisanii]